MSLWAFASTYGLFSLLKYAVGIRVTVEEEMDGLDLAEHGMTAYNDLEINPFKSLNHLPREFQTQEALSEEVVYDK